jgi:hypothetical protein
MIGLKMLSLTPFFGATLITALVPAEPQAEFIQYGALGLCAIVVIFLCNHLKGMVVQHKEERKSLINDLKCKDEKLLNLTKQSIEAYDRLAQLLSDRPCLFKDKRIDDSGGMK